MSKRNNPILLVLIAFIAGFLSVLIFHQIILFVLKSVGFAPAAFTPYAMKATQPLGVPRFLSLAFWGGVWGILLVIIVSFFRRGIGYWGTGLLLGSLGPSLVNWFIVLPLHGKPIGGGWQPAAIATALIINGAWGVGTIFFSRLLARSLSGRNQENSSDVT